MDETKTVKRSKKSPITPPPDKYVLRLYVAGATTRSRQAVLRVRQLCEAELKGNYDLEVIDIYQQTHLARDNQIVATPTLIKESPLPVCRFIGNLSHTTGMRERATYVGGTLKIKSARRAGTEIEVCIPMPTVATAAN